jgi:hypothetical protein
MLAVLAGRSYIGPVRPTAALGPCVCTTLGPSPADVAARSLSGWIRVGAPHRPLETTGLHMTDNDSTGLFGIAFWCIALVALGLWALRHLDFRW